MQASNGQSHVVFCLALYVKYGHAVLSVIDLLVAELCARPVKQLDIGAPAGTFHDVVAPYCNATGLRGVHPSRMSQ